MPKKFDVKLIAQLYGGAMPLIVSGDVLVNVSTITTIRAEIDGSLTLNMIDGSNVKIFAKEAEALGDQMNQAIAHIRQQQARAAASQLGIIG